MDLITRAQKTQLTIDEFTGKPFVWGEADCAHLAAAHLAGFDRRTALDTARNYSTALGAKRTVRALGFATLDDVIDAMFERIPPAAALTGDIMGIPGEGGETALGVYLGAERMLAFVDTGNGVTCEIGLASIADKAWRVA